MIETAKKEDLFLDPKLIKSVNKLGNLRIIDELHPVLGGQPTHEKDQPNDNNPVLDLACTTQYALDEIVKVNTKADTKLAKAQNLKDVANVAIARDNLGLGTSATLNATSTLSDRTDQTATIKIVNDVNRAANNAQTSANNANNKANAAQTRADSAHSLATSANNNANTRLEKSKNLSDLTNVATARSNLGLKSSATLDATSTLSDRTDQTATIKVVNDVNRSAVTAQKTANNAHALAQTKQDKLEFVGSGKVMREGAYGLGGENVNLPVFNNESNINEIKINGFFASDLNESKNFGFYYPYGISLHHAMSRRGIKFLAEPITQKNVGCITYDESSGRTTTFMFYHDKNTTIDKSGFLRASSSANALTESDRTNSYGSSKTLVATQYLVNETAQKATNAHYRADEAYEVAIGTSREWIDVTSQRSTATTYTNHSDKYIFVSVLTYHLHNGSSFLYVDGEIVAQEGAAIGGGPNNNLRAYLFTFIPPGSTYKVNSDWVQKWMELR